MKFEDFYIAGIETTVYWLQPNLQPAVAVCVSKPAKKKRITKVLRSAGNLEHCQQQTGDLKFCGQDILQVYNVGQVKQILQTSGLYIANTKPEGQGGTKRAAVAALLPGNFSEKTLLTV